jgi:inner membrane protein
VPTPISHAAVGFAIGTWTQPAPPSLRICVAASACAALPDIDVVWSMSLPDSSPFAHRAITHSIVFAVAAALCMRAVFFRQGPRRITLTLGIAALSHSCLDAFSRYSLGIAFFLPFSAQRFRFPWTPLGSVSLAGQLAQEALVVCLPAVLLAWLGWSVRRAPR